MILLPAIGACGSGGGHTRTARGKFQPAGRVLLETVQVSKPGMPSSDPAASASALSGDRIVLITRLHEPRSGPAQQVSLYIDRGPAATLYIRASGPRGESAQAAIRTGGGRRLTLVPPTYSCYVPPSPTFCPALAQTATVTQYRVTFSLSPASPIVLHTGTEPATVRQVPVGRPSIRGGGPPYGVELAVADRPPRRHGGPLTFGPTTIASAGDAVFVRVKVIGNRGRAAQRFRLTIVDGPRSTLRVTAGITGAMQSAATITSANRRPLSLSAPHYTCFLPPVPSPCPALSAISGRQRLVVSFSVLPRDEVIVIARAV